MTVVPLTPSDLKVCTALASILPRVDPSSRTSNHRRGVLHGARRSLPSAIATAAISRVEQAPHSRRRLRWRPETARIRVGRRCPRGTMVRAYPRPPVLPLVLAMVSTETSSVRLPTILPIQGNASASGVRRGTDEEDAGKDAHWTPYNNLLQRKLYKGATPDITSVD